MYIELNLSSYYKLFIGYLVADLVVIEAVVFFCHEWKPVVEKCLALFLASWSVVLFHGKLALDLVELVHLRKKFKIRV